MNYFQPFPPPLPPPLPPGSHHPFTVDTPPPPPPLPPTPLLPNQPPPPPADTCMPPPPLPPDHTPTPPPPPPPTHPHLPRLMELNLPNPPLPHIPSLLGRSDQSDCSSVPKDPGYAPPPQSTGERPRPYGKDFDRFEHVNPAPHAPYQQVRAPYPHSPPPLLPPPRPLLHPPNEPPWQQDKLATDQRYQAQDGKRTLNGPPVHHERHWAPPAMRGEQIQNQNYAPDQPPRENYDFLRSRSREQSIESRFHSEQNRGSCDQRSRPADMNSSDFSHHDQQADVGGPQHEGGFDHYGNHRHPPHPPVKFNPPENGPERVDFGNVDARPDYREIERPFFHPTSQGRWEEMQFHQSDHEGSLTRPGLFERPLFPPGSAPHDHDHRYSPPPPPISDHYDRGYPPPPPHPDFQRERYPERESERYSERESERYSERESESSYFEPRDRTEDRRYEHPHQPPPLLDRHREEQFRHSPQPLLADQRKEEHFRTSPPPLMGDHQREGRITRSPQPLFPDQERFRSSPQARGHHGRPPPEWEGRPLPLLPNPPLPPPPPHHEEFRGPPDRYPSPLPPSHPRYPEERQFGGPPTDFPPSRFDEPPRHGSPQPPFLHPPDPREEQFRYEREQENWYWEDQRREYHRPSPPPNHSLDDRGHHRNPPFPDAPLPLPPPLAPVLQLKTVPAEKLFDLPGRSERPSHIVIILRGLPGAGKSHIAKLIRDKEVSLGAAAPRILSLDSYFLNEVEKVEKDPDTGRRTKRKVEEYEYDEAMEPHYRASQFKLFNKTLEDGFFPMIVVDAINHKVRHFDRYWSNAKMKGFEVYVVELMESIDLCVERNIHNRTRGEIEKLAREWEDTPPHFLRLDVTSLTSDSNIDEVEMECTDSDEDNSECKQDEQTPVKSRWEDASEDKLDKLDAVGVFRRRKRLHSEVDEEEEGDSGELSLTEYLKRKQEESSRAASGGKKKKRVRWADLEEAKEEQRKREIGFCIGTSWSKVSEEEAEHILLGGKPERKTTEL